MPRLDQQMQLTGSRILGYDDRGPSSGRPLFYFHGSPSSRIESRMYISDQMLEALHVRMIVPDRPGLGLSTFQPGRSLLDWPQDVLALADHLKMDRFSILGYSLGGPYGAACAFAIKQRLMRVGIVSGAAMFTLPELTTNINEGTRSFLFMPRDKPWLSRLYLGIMLGVLPRLAPGSFVAGAASILPEVDRKIVQSDSTFRDGFIAMVREATRQGTRGAFWESLLTVTQYGFQLQDIQIPVHLWHGEADKNIPVEMARFMAAAIPKCEARFYPQEGHLSLFKNHAEEIIGALVHDS
ncbi:MAG TPA: alpha/beta hydrolase [Anaerolineales bacterium]|nr:alpha/beta hydrolase [Anaerolineales bacterium]